MNEGSQKLSNINIEQKSIFEILYYFYFQDASGHLIGLPEEWNLNGRPEEWKTQLGNTQKQHFDIFQVISISVLKFLCTDTC